MIPLIAVLIGVYAVARLLQVPIEHVTWEKRWFVLAAISVPAIAAIGIVLFLILASAANIKMPPGLIQ